MNSDHSSWQASVPPFEQASPDTVLPKDSAQKYGPTEPGVTAPPAQSDTANVTPVRPYVPLLPDLSKYDLAVGEALEVFALENRKQPSVRTLQRYCQEGRFDCFKLKTTRNGNPVHEWIINSTSLRAFIQTKPEESSSVPMATPAQTGDAESAVETTVSVENPTADTALPERNDDATNDHGLPRTSENILNVMTTPVAVDDASEERQTRVELMVENAKLTARLESQDDLIGELRDDKKFMREQITHQRGNDTLMADMHRETLQTLKAVSVAGRHTKIEMPDAGAANEQRSAFRDVPDNEHRPQDGRLDGV